MFSNLTQGSILYGLETKGDVKVFTAPITNVSLPRPRFINNTILADSRESLNSYVNSMLQNSRNIVNSVDKHKTLIHQYEAVLKEINPMYNNNDTDVKELREQVSSLQSQLAEAIALIKSENNKLNRNGNT